MLVTLSVSAPSVTSSCTVKIKTTRLRIGIKETGAKPLSSLVFELLF
jgi:hypothetical protein